MPKMTIDFGLYLFKKQECFIQSTPKPLNLGRSDRGVLKQIMSHKNDLPVETANEDL